MVAPFDIGFERLKNGFKRLGVLEPAVTEIGPVAQNFIDQIDLFTAWIAPLQGTVIRDDIDATLLAEGVQGFIVQAIALSFCAIEGAVDMNERLERYLTAWLSAR